MKKKLEENKESLKATGELYKDFYEEERRPEAHKISFINFRLEREWYGVEISKVKDVAKVSEVTFLPCAPPYIAGIVSLRGNILSITDLKKLFGLASSPFTKESRILVIYSGEFETGIFVYEVSMVADVELNKIDPPLDTLEAERADYIVGECKIGDIFFAILKVEKIFALNG